MYPEMVLSASRNPLVSAHPHSTAAAGMLRVTVESNDLSHISLARH